MRPMTNRNKMSGEKLEGAADYQLRMLFDLTFYIWVGILLMSIITGLMLDTFGWVYVGTFVLPPNRPSRGFV